MGEFESRAAKLMLAESWPYSWEFWRFQTGHLELGSFEGAQFDYVLGRISRGDAVRQRTLDRMSVREPLDPNV